ncbi:MAG: hypothetical protein EOP88_07780 [Verrucomicrobiaceae bacterium]|nr:MAG: hypothetical protein EOP88_07780 [Verrucomicrobiaceae bacterium]
MATLTPEQTQKLAELQKSTESALEKARAAKEAANATGSGNPTTAETTALMEASLKKDAWMKIVPSLSIGILGYGVLVLAITAFLIYRGKVKVPAGDGQWLIRTLVIPMCVVAAVFLTVVGYDPQQITPVIGLLGTIIGYLLGAGSRPVAPADERPDRTNGQPNNP